MESYFRFIHKIYLTSFKARVLKITPQTQSHGPVPTPPKSPNMALVDVSKQQQTDEILNSILPPRQWGESGQLWIQQV